MSIKNPGQPANRTNMSLPGGLKIRKVSTDIGGHYAVSGTGRPGVAVLGGSQNNGERNLIATTSDQSVQSMLTTVNTNIKTVFDICMQLMSKVEQMEGTMTEVKKYMDMEKELMPVLIRPPQPANIPSIPVIVKPAISKVPPLKPNVQYKIISKQPVKPPVTPSINLLKPNRDIKTPVYPAAKPLANNKPLVAALDPIALPIEPPVATVSSDDDFFDENLQLVDEIDPLMVDVKPLNDVVIIEESHATGSEPLEVKENAKNVFQFYVQNVQDYTRQCAQMDKNPKLRDELFRHFKAGVLKRADSFRGWFSDEFLNEISWVQTKYFPKMSFKDTTISNILQCAWEDVAGFDYPNFIKLQLYNAKTRITMKQSPAIVPPTGVTTYRKRPGDEAITMTTFSKRKPN